MQGMMLFHFLLKKQPVSLLDDPISANIYQFSPKPLKFMKIIQSWKENAYT